MEENKKITTKKVNASATKKSSVKVDVVDVKGKVSETMSLPSEMFDAEENPVLVAQAVRVYLANQRQGTSSTKTRSEITATTKKVWRQKGTGRARHGAKSAPIFVGGGVAFGPKPRDLTLKFPPKMKQKALFSALSSRVREKSLRVVSWADMKEPKTKEAVSVLSSLSLVPSKKSVVLVTGGESSLYKAVRNIEGVEVVPAVLLNTYQAMRGTTILFTKLGIDSFIELQSKKN